MNIKEKTILLIVIGALLAGILVSLTEENIKVDCNDGLKSTIDEKKELYYSQTIDINTADADLFETLDGVGEKKAAAIVSFRESNGPFGTAEDLMDVPGIGQGIFDKNQGRLKVEGGTAGEEKSLRKNTDKINVNTCTAEDLISLPGIGEVKARAIIEYRNSNGPFVCYEDILKVKGIGEKTLNNIRNSISF